MTDYRCVPIVDPKDGKTTGYYNEMTSISTAVMPPVVLPGPTCFQEALYPIMEELAQLMIRKQRDYGHKNISDFGEFGVLVRANDKLARLKNMITPHGDEVAYNESIEDSWADLANYAIIALMIRCGVWGLPVEPPK